MVQVIGAGRLGSALSAALRDAGVEVDGPHGRGAAPGAADIVLLCVPDAAIAEAARRFPRDTIVGHCSGSLTLEPLEPHERYSLHPLLTVTRQTSSFAGVGCAIQASGNRAREACMLIVDALGMRPFEVNDELRPLYHAAASVGSNYIVAVAALAEQLMARTGVQREMLVPLVMAAAQNWAVLGDAALTGPIARGDVATVTRQRDAIARHAPEALDAWDALAAATRRLAGAREATGDSDATGT